MQKPIQTIASSDLTCVMGGRATKKKQPKGDNGKAGFMEIWRQIQEQQSGGYR